jgi:hypothetical protein
VIDSCKVDNGPYGSTKGAEILDKLSDSQLLKTIPSMELLKKLV